jgi:hypothetical protein
MINMTESIRVSLDLMRAVLAQIFFPMSGSGHEEKAPLLLLAEPTFADARRSDGLAPEAGLS